MLKRHKNGIFKTRDSASSVRRSAQSRIDFMHASKPESGFGSARKRHVQLLKLIELDGLTVDLADMAPVKDYEFYIEHFGKGNRSQVHMQLSSLRYYFHSDYKTTMFYVVKKDSL